MTYFRADASFSSLYGALEDVFISIADQKDGGYWNERIYKMNKIEKDLTDNFMYARNNGLSNSPFKTFLIAGNLIKDNQQQRFIIQVLSRYK